MPLVHEVEGLQDAVRLVLRQLLGPKAGAVEPRGLPTRELLGGAIKIADPRKRLVLRPNRQRWSLAFAMAEYLWYMRADNSLDTMAFYAPGIRAFSDDGKTLHSAYGNRIFGGHGHVGFDQWQMVKALLVQDPDSRQAVIQIRTPQDSMVKTKDHPCTIALQFLQREGRLHLVTMMRSNDIIVGTPYDIFSFTMMQEQMALELDLDLGAYFHQVGSWHLYDKQIRVAEEMVDITERPAAMPKMAPGLRDMVADEESIRHGQAVDLGAGYWRDWRLVLSAFAGLTNGVQDLSECYRAVWSMGRQKPTPTPAPESAARA